MINTIYENHLVLLLPVVGPSHVLRVLDFAIFWFSDTKGYFCHLTAFNFHVFVKNMGKTRKQQRRKKFNFNKNRKRQGKKAKKMPTIEWYDTLIFILSGSTIKKNWAMIGILAQFFD